MTLSTIKVALANGSAVQWISGSFQRRCSSVQLLPPQNVSPPAQRANGCKKNNTFLNRVVLRWASMSHQTMLWDSIFVAISISSVSICMASKWKLQMIVIADWSIPRSWDLKYFCGKGCCSNHDKHQLPAGFQMAKKKNSVIAKGTFSTEGSGFSLVIDLLKPCFVNVIFIFNVAYPFVYNSNRKRKEWVVLMSVVYNSTPVALSDMSYWLTHSYLMCASLREKLNATLSFQPDINLFVMTFYQPDFNRFVMTLFSTLLVTMLLYTLPQNVLVLSFSWHNLLRCVYSMCDNTSLVISHCTYIRATSLEQCKQGKWYAVCVFVPVSGGYHELNRWRSLLSVSDKSHTPVIMQINI